MISRGEVSDPIPTDLLIEILSRLPPKSIARFRWVSKLWGSMLLRQDFTELFLTRSSARPPCLLFVFRGRNDLCFFTSPQPQNPYEMSSSSHVVAADFHMKIHGGTWQEKCDLVSGFIYFKPMGDKHIVICNPSTGQYASLPLPEGEMRWRCFLGFDPINKQFKILSHEQKEPDQILTVGTGNQSWRKIHCPLKHCPSGEGICINGVLYYLVTDDNSGLIVCFDVRSEKFKFIYRDFFRPQHGTKLINYKGKLGVISLEERYNFDRWRSVELCMYVIKDVEKTESSEWSEYFFSFNNCNLSIVGVTARTSEIVLSSNNASKPFYVFFLNPERNTLQRVEIQGFRATRGCVKVFVDHVENLKFITMKTTSTSSI